jgi:hypothetical protein
MRFRGFTIWTFSALLLLTGFSSSAQRFDWRSRIDRLVEKADSLALKHQRTFWLTKYIGTDRTYKETWYYTVRDGKVLEFEIRYNVDSVEHSETYYLDNGSPICMERYETVYFGFHEDEIKRGEVLFLDNETVRQFVSIGHRDNNFNSFGQSYDSMRRFSNRYSELKKNIVATGDKAIERFP